MSAPLPRTLFILISFPEILLHVLSHLPATDLLTVKLVSRRLYTLVNSPHAWISAFCKYFPGPTALKSASKNGKRLDGTDIGATEKRAFTRLSSVPSWTGEYLLRTKLLRCLIRGRPSLPLAAPSQGKPHKGYAIFTYSSRIGIITDMDAKFGVTGDKRLPQYAHGSSLSSAVSMSDRRGELAGWGLKPFAINVRTFTDLYPGSTMWGLGSGDVVGVPNVMDVSVEQGMVYGEGFPGGNSTFLPASEKRHKFLAPFLGMSNPEEGIPRISQDLDSVCSIWIGKSYAVSRMTRGVVGILSGSSSGVISAYSIGTPGGRDQRLEKGELTARWLVSPGVPVVSIVADDNCSSDPLKQGRIWAVALNALGETFYMTGVPQRYPSIEGPAEHFEANHEVRAWKTGHSVGWQLLAASQRLHKAFSPEDRNRPTYFTQSVDSNAAIDVGQPILTMKTLQTWIQKSPIEIQGNFDGWDMQRRLEVDFSGDDGAAGGQNIVVIGCGGEEDAVPAATLQRYTRCSLSLNLTSSESTLTPQSGSQSAFEWRRSEFLFERARNYQITATALDRSIYAVTIASDDLAFKHARKNEEQVKKQAESSLEADKHSPFKIPGQRARFMAVGTGTGQVFVWNIRAPPPSSSEIINQLTPVRLIQTSSPQISSLALTALYLVHGGSEGLVQAWDPLGSTTEPVRTISSALSGRHLRQAQQDPTTQTRGLWAVGAICLDPEPSNLRGIVALRGTLRYWSYSSSSASKPSSKTKRKIHRAARGLNSPGDGFISGRRVDLKSHVNRELAARGIDEAEKVQQSKADEKFAGRFGLDLLGEGASEEELIAYAKLLSEEAHEKKVQRTMEKRLSKDATEEEVQAHLAGLSEEDRQKWRFASWEERFEMPASPAATVPMGSPAISAALHSEGDGDDVDIKKAMALSMRDSDYGHSEAGPSQGDFGTSDAVDDETAEAIARSLAEEPDKLTTPKLTARSKSGKATNADEDDIERAIRLSLEESEASTPSPPVHSTSGKARRRDSEFADDDFPALSSSPSNSPPSGGSGGKAWGKGKRRAW